MVMASLTTHRLPSARSTSLTLPTLQPQAWKQDTCSPSMVPVGRTSVPPHWVLETIPSLVLQIPSIPTPTVTFSSKAQVGSLTHHSWSTRVVSSVLVPRVPTQPSQSQEMSLPVPTLQPQVRVPSVGSPSRTSTVVSSVTTGRLQRTLQVTSSVQRTMEEMERGQEVTPLRYSG